MGLPVPFALHVAFSQLLGALPAVCCHDAQCPVLPHAPSLRSCKSANERVKRVSQGRQVHNSPGTWALMGGGTGVGWGNLGTLLSLLLQEGHWDELVRRGEKNCLGSP